MFTDRPLFSPPLLLFFLALSPLTTLANALDKGFKSAPPKVHPHQERCIACHTEEINITQLLAQASNDCLQCHDAAEVKASLRHVIEQTPIPSKNSSNDITHNQNAALGMSQPMYYDPSRLGPEPNPMILVPAGDFVMGSDNRLPDEGPRHTVTLPAYYIDTFEVTNLQYKKFNDATQRKSPDHFRNRTYPAGKADHPVIFVSWDDATAYCHWAAKRLPTAAEWEKAARGTDERIFPWGNEFEINRANTPVRWQTLGLYGDTTPVGAFQEGSSFYGLYDMSGNAWEWTDSWYQPYPGNKTPSESYGTRYKTLKGGSWFDCSFYKCGISAPTFNRASFAPKTKNDSFGFRCAKDAEPPTTPPGSNHAS